MAQTFIAGIGWVDTDKLKGLGDVVDRSRVTPSKGGGGKGGGKGVVTSDTDYTYDPVTAYGDKADGAYGLGKNQMGYSYKPYAGPGTVMRRSDGMLVVAQTNPATGKTTYREFKPTVDMTYKTWGGVPSKDAAGWTGMTRSQLNAMNAAKRKQQEPPKPPPGWEGPMHRLMPGQNQMMTGGWGSGHNRRDRSDNGQPPVGAGMRNYPGWGNDTTGG